MFSNYPPEWRYVKVRSDNGTKDSKKPFESGWQHINTHTIEDIKKWRNNIGLLLGHYSGNTYSFDCDGDGFYDAFLESCNTYIQTYNDDMSEILGKILKSTRFRSSPKAGQILIKIEDPDLSKIIISATRDDLKNRKWKLEILANTQQTVIPPSQCSGETYQYYKRKWEIEPTELQTLTEEEFKKFFKYIKEELTGVAEKNGSNIKEDREIEFEVNLSNIDTKIAEVIQIIRNSNVFITHERHDFALAFAGLTRIRGVPRETAILIGQKLVETLGGDDNDVIRAINDSYIKKYNPNNKIKEMKENMDSNGDYFSQLDDMLTLIGAKTNKKNRPKDVDNDGDLFLLLADQLIDIHKAFYYFDLSKFGLYENGVYKVGKNLVKSKLQELYPSTNNNLMNEVLGSIERKKTKTDEVFDTKPFLINLKNGLYNTKTREFIEHTPDELTTIQLDWEYNPEQKELPPHTKAFMESTFRDPDERNRVLQTLKKLIEGNFIYEKLFSIWVGRKDSGKTTLNNILVSIFGEDNAASTKLQAFKKEFTTYNFYKKKLVYDDDAGPYAITSDVSTVIKSITGNASQLRFEPKGVDAFNSKNTASLLILCNTIPRYNKGDNFGALVQRPILIKFEEDFKNTKKNNPKDWEERLIAERGGFASYLFNLEPWDDIPQVPLKEKYRDPEVYWLRESNPVYKWCMDNMESINEPNGKSWLLSDVIGAVKKTLKQAGYAVKLDDCRTTILEYVGEVFGDVVKRVKDNITYEIIIDCKIRNVRFNSTQFKNPIFLPENDIGFIDGYFDSDSDSDFDSYKDVGKDIEEEDDEELVLEDEIINNNNTHNIEEIVWEKPIDISQQIVSMITNKPSKDDPESRLFDDDMDEYGLTEDDYRMLNIQKKTK